MDMNDAFGNWLAGFIDGEGCFIIHKERGGFVPNLTVVQRDDDTDLLHEIRRRTGIGRVYQRRTRIASWQVFSGKDTLVAIALLDRYPLRGRKRREYVIWRAVVLEYAKPFATRDRELMRQSYDRLIALRKYRSTESTAVPSRSSTQLHLIVGEAG